MLNIIGDIHGDVDWYKSKVVSKQIESSVQVGDFGFDYSVFNEIGSEHVFLGGNHDNYDRYYDCPNSLGDYGVRNVCGVEFYFIRGAESVDRNSRIVGVNLWENEEMPYLTCLNAISDYRQVRPKVVISHDCPANIAWHLHESRDCRASRTREMLQQMFNAHQPSVWYFGHHHVDKTITVGPTRFVCVGEKSIVLHEG